MKPNKMFKSHYRYFQIAKDEANSFSDFGRIKIGSVVVDKHMVIGMGANTLKTAPTQRSYNKFRGDRSPDTVHRLHAEMQALVRATRNKKSLKGAKIFVYRETRDGKLAMCRPCPACMQAIRDAGIRKIYYTTTDGFCQELLVEI